MILLSLFLCTALVAGGAEPNFGDTYNSAVLTLKGKTIPSDGTGVVILTDIGGYLGPKDGLICTANFSNFTARYWTYPNKTDMVQLPNIDEFGIDTCHIEQGVSLYYGGQLPKERGLFQCILNVTSSSLSMHTINVSVYIVDMNIANPTIDWPGEILVAGDNVEISINVTTSPENVPVPYQWMKNGQNLQISNQDKYLGTQNSTLTIFNVQDTDQGNYTCSVAHSASGTRVKSKRLIVVTIGVTVSGSTNDPETGKNYVMSCILSGVDALKDSYPKYQFIWIKDGMLFFDSGTTSSYTFNSLKLSDAGNYECQGIVFFTRRTNIVTANSTSPQFPLLFARVVYRIYLTIHSDCHQWTSVNADTMTKRRTDINSHLIQGMKEECSGVPINKDIIMNNDRAFGCPKEFPKDTVVYSAQLYAHDNKQTNTSVLVSCLDKWIQKSKYILITEVATAINHDCTGVVNDFKSDFDCGVPAASELTLSSRFAIGFGCLCFCLFVAIFVLIGCVVKIKCCGHRNDYEDLNHNEGAGGQVGQN